MNKAIENKKQNRKALKVFIPVIIGCGLLGGLLGYGTIHLFETGSSAGVASAVNGLLFEIAPWCVAAVCTAGVAVSAIMIAKAKKAFRKGTEDAGDGEMEENDLEYVENLLSDALMCQSLFQVLQFLCFGILVGNLMLYCMDNPLKVLIPVILFMAAIFVGIRQQQVIVDMEKLLNPSKEGSVYDLRFQKKWEESCDELEKMQIYRASFKAYKTGNITCIVLWMIFAIIGMAFQTGMAAIVALSAVWFASTLAYMLEARRLTRHRNQE